MDEDGWIIFGGSAYLVFQIGRYLVIGRVDTLILIILLYLDDNQ